MAFFSGLRYAGEIKIYEASDKNYFYVIFSIISLPRIKRNTQYEFPSRRSNYFKGYLRCFDWTTLLATPIRQPLVFTPDTCKGIVVDKSSRFGVNM